MTKISAFTLLISLLTSSPTLAQTQDNAPRFSLLPLRTHNINAETRTRLAKELTEELQVLRDGLLKQPTKLSDRLQQNASNNRRMSATIWAADNSQYVPNNAPALIFEPVWCHAFDRDLIFLQAIDRDLGTLRGSQHLIFNQGSKYPYVDRISQLQKQLPGSFKKLLNQPLRINLNPKTDALHLQIQNRRLSDWKKIAPPECLTMLIEEQLAPQYTIVRQSGLQRVQHIRQNLGKLTGLRRHTRSLHLSWPDQLQAPKASEYSIDADVTQSEGPFGQPYPALGKAQINLKLDAEQVRLQLADNLLAHLQEQQSMLVLTDRPQIVHIYGAWVYLDKGRAWGLKMRDRLVASEDPEAIQGHVVRYFGAEAKLKDAKGRLINEGAIVYIRKGQDRTKIGQSLAYDPKTYPAAWR